MMCMYKSTYKKVYEMRMHKLYSLKNTINFLLVLSVTRYMAKFKGFKK